MASDLEQRAREMLDTALRDLGLHEDAYHVGCGAELDQYDRAAINAIAAALLAAQQPAAPSETVNVLGMPEFDGLLDHIYEHGTGAEGVIERANAFARAVIARYAPKQSAAVVDEAAVRRVIAELRAYNPAADEYKGAHIHKVWAKELAAALAQQPAAPSGEVGVVSDADIKWDMRHIESHLKDVDAAVPVLLQGVRKVIQRSVAQQAAAVDCCPHCGGTGGHWEGCRAPAVPEGVHGCTAPQQPAGVDEAADPALLSFYGVEDYPSLVAALEAHVLKLIDAHKRNVKPWEDTFPPTLLPKWIREQEQKALLLADRWQDEASESWGETKEHATLQRCADELRAIILDSVP